MNEPVGVVKSLMYRWHDNMRYEAQLRERDELARMLRESHARQRASLRLEFNFLGMTLDDYDDWAGEKCPRGRFEFYQLHKDKVGGSASASGYIPSSAAEQSEMSGFPSSSTVEQPPVKKVRSVLAPRRTI